MDRIIRRLARTSLVFVYLVIIAGSVVRMTGSGMGCPDWPKCFGFIIPPTDVEQLIWKPNTDYNKGQIIILNERLWVANETFRSTEEFRAEQWSEYTKHDYAIFNPAHTWTEYINRLIGAATGIPVLLLLVFSLGYWRRDFLVPLLAISALFLLGFEAWLGKVVVDGNLIPGQITLHMFGAVVLMLVLVALLVRMQPVIGRTASMKPLQKWPMLLFALIFIQIFLGTQVRESIDVVALQLGESNRQLWIDELDIWFYVHRSFAWLVLLVAGYLYFQLRRNGHRHFWLQLALLLVVFEVISPAFALIPVISCPWRNFLFCIADK
jgi:cytochrome c oxidase assembly protein subunit 15